MYIPIHSCHSGSDRDENIKFVIALKESRNILPKGHAKRILQYYPLSLFYCVVSCIIRKYRKKFLVTRPSIFIPAIPAHSSPFLPIPAHSCPCLPFLVLQIASYFCTSIVCIISVGLSYHNPDYNLQNRSLLHDDFFLRLRDLKLIDKGMDQLNKDPYNITCKC